MNVYLYFFLGHYARGLPRVVTKNYVKSNSVQKPKYGYIEYGERINIPSVPKQKES